MNFKEWLEANFQGIMKFQLGIPRKAWTGMPLIASNFKINGELVTQPTSFVVVSADDDSVTLRRQDYMAAISPGDDDDLSPGDDDDITVSMKDFEKMVQPPNTPPQPGGMMGGF